MQNKSEFDFLTFKPLISLNFPEIAGKNEYSKIHEKKFSLWNLHLVVHSALVILSTPHSEHCLHQMLDNHGWEYLIVDIFDMCLRIPTDYGMNESIYVYGESIHLHVLSIHIHFHNVYIQRNHFPFSWNEISSM